MGQVALWCKVCIITATILLIAVNISGRFGEDASQSRVQRGSIPPASVSASETRVDADKLKFDVVRIDPDGVSVFAGRGAAHAAVTLRDNAVAIASTRTDANGDWAIVLEREFATGDHQLSLGSNPTGPADGQTVRITVTRAKPMADTLPSSPAKRLPQPIPFNYNEAELTVEGRQAATSLSKYLLSERLEAVTLSGHADERGSQPYNMELSRQRLDAVANFLRDAGYAGELVLLPKGKMEPLDIPDRRSLARDEVYRMDRRVELHQAK